MVDLVDPNTRSGESAQYYGGYGRGSAAAAVGDTALGDEITDEPRVLTTVSQPTVNTVQFLWEVIASVDHLSTGTGAVREAGVFDASTGGSMWARAVFPTINLETDDRIEFTFTIQYRDQSEV